MVKRVKKVLGVILSAVITVTGLSGTSMTVTVQAAGEESAFENFVTVSGNSLMDGEKELKFISLNYPQATSDTSWEHANAMKTIKAMGGNVTRTYTIPVYNGENQSTAYVTGVDENGQLTFNEDALNALDDVLAQANRYGVRVIIPLVDVSFAVGAGAFNKEAKNRATGAMGGKMSRCAVLIIRDGNTRLVSIKDQDTNCYPYAFKTIDYSLNLHEIFHKS